jgi:hypothetical protein
MLGDWAEGTGWQEQYLFGQGIVQNKTKAGGSLNWLYCTSSSSS